MENPWKNVATAFCASYVFIKNTPLDSHHRLVGRDRRTIHHS